MLPAESDHTKAQALLALEATRLATRQWRQVMTPDFDSSWARAKPAVELVTHEAMVGSATNASRLVPLQLEQAGHRVTVAAQVVPDGFARATMLGADVGDALDSSVIRSKQAISQGATVDEALDRGEEWLDSLIRSVMADVDRAAQQALITATPRMGWVRIVPAPCCKRCAVLSGRWYRHSAGFARHPRCDCYHRPAPEDLAGTDDVPSPDQLLRSGGIKDLTGAERDAVLKDGADLTRVVNTSTASRARGGMTAVTGEPRRRQLITRTVSGRQIPTPAGIYYLAGDDRGLALRLLQEHGYIT